jgi:RHS repeat-associated protein
VPGPPVQFGPPVKPETVQAAEGFTGIGLRENDIFYFHPDHLGSTSYISSRNGSVSQHVEYIAFGEVLFEEHSSSFSSPYLFNGKELDRETNLSYYGARYLDMKTSLWLSVDPLAAKYPNIGSYVYVADNPIKYIDPDGKASLNVIDPPNKNKTAKERAYNPRTGNTDIGLWAFYKIDDVIKELNTYKREKSELSNKDITSSVNSDTGGNENRKANRKVKQTGDNLNVTGFLISAPGSEKSGNKFQTIKEYLEAGKDIKELFDFTQKIGDGVEEVIKENKSKGARNKKSEYVQVNKNLQVRRDVYEKEQKQKQQKQKQQKKSE